MAIRSDSYSSVAEVVAFTRHLLDGEATYNSTTRPTLTDVEKFIDRASASLNVALSRQGFSTPITNAVAKLDCDNWVTIKAAQFAEMTAPGLTGFTPTADGRVNVFRQMSAEAQQFAEIVTVGFAALGIARTEYEPGRALQFMGEDAGDQRTDIEDTSLRQPRFKRDQFDQRGQNTGEDYY